MGAEYPLHLVVRAVDKATAPMRAIAVRAHKLMAPLTAAQERLGKIGQQLGSVSKAFNLPGVWRGLQGFGGALKNVGAEAFSLIGKLAGIGLAGGAAFFGLVKGAMDAGDKLGEVSQRVGLSVDTFAAMQFAAAQADVDAESFATAMDQLNKKMGEMKVGKGGEFLHFLNEISPTFAKQMKGAKNTEAALALLTDAFSKIEDPGKRATLAAHAFGKSGLQMGVFLAQGADAIAETADRFDHLVGSQEEYARVSGDLDNATRETETAFTGLRSAVAAGLFPALTSLAKTITEFLAKNRKGIAEWAKRAGDAIQKWLDSGGFERLVASLTKISDTIGRVVDWLGPMGTALSGLAVLALPLVAALGSLAAAGVTLAIEALPLLFTAASALWPVLAGIGSALGPFLIAASPFLGAALAVAWAGKTIYDNWADLKLLFSDLGETIKWTVIGAWEAVRPMLEKLSGFFGGVTNPFGQALALGDALVPKAGGNMLGAVPNHAAPIGPTEARVSVDFKNLPRGARIDTDPNNTAPFDLSAGWSMVTP